MESEFWHKRWDSNQIGFHEDNGNSLLKQYFEQLNLNTGDTVFIPLCGKTKDIQWLLSLGYNIIGAELSELAIQQLFEDLDRKPEITQLPKHKLYTDQNIKIYVGDIFEINKSELPAIQAVYDRAALVALPASMREKYSQQTISLSEKAPQLLLTYTYNQSLMDGPPFSIENEEVNQLYGSNYKILCLKSQPSPKKLRGEVEAAENIWLLKP